MISSEKSGNLRTAAFRRRRSSLEGAALTSISSSQYNEANIVDGFVSLGFGQEKSSIAAFVQRIVTQLQLTTSGQSSTAVVLGAGTGWELCLLKRLGFSRIIGYEPAQQMLMKAENLIAAEKLDGVEIYGADGLGSMRRRWKHRSNFVLGTHVIPALEHRDILRRHFLEYNNMLTQDGVGFVITNNPQDQFLNHYTYSCHHLGLTAKDGDRIFTILNDVDAERKPTKKASNRYVTVEDTFWSDSSIRAEIRNADLTLTALHYIRLIGRDDPVAPYVAYACQRRSVR